MTASSIDRADESSNVNRWAESGKSAELLALVDGGQVGELKQARPILDTDPRG
jgi:hypothetical protein